MGRDPESIEVPLFQSQMPDKRIMDEMGTAGADRFVLTIRAQGPNEALSTLDTLAKACQ